MNTPTHLAISLALLGRHEKPKNTAWIVWGALLPDLIMLPLFLMELLNGVSVDVIFGEKYFQPHWQIPINLFNSIPIYLALFALAYWRKWEGMMMLCVAVLLHIALDFPLHNDDAHAHFYPFSNWAFHSPVSYWDPAYFGQWVGMVELVILLICTWIGVRVFHNRLSKIAFVIFSLIMPLMMGMFYLSRFFGFEMGA